MSFFCCLQHILCLVTYNKALAPESVTKCLQWHKRRALNPSDQHQKWESYPFVRVTTFEVSRFVGSEKQLKLVWFFVLCTFVNGNGSHWRRTRAAAAFSIGCNLRLSWGVHRILVGICGWHLSFFREFLRRFMTVGRNLVDNERSPGSCCLITDETLAVQRDYYFTDIKWRKGCRNSWSYRSVAELFWNV